MSPRSRRGGRHAESRPTFWTGGCAAALIRWEPATVRRGAGFSSSSSSAACLGLPNRLKPNERLGFSSSSSSSTGRRAAGAGRRAGGAGRPRGLGVSSSSSSCVCSG